MEDKQIYIDSIVYMVENQIFDVGALRKIYTITKLFRDSRLNKNEGGSKNE